MKKIAVIGTGYVGLVTGTCFAETGNNVTCVDIDEEKVQRMKNGEVPIYEANLDTLFDRNVSQNRLRFTTDLELAVKDAEIIFLALPTPPGEDGSADLSYVLTVAKKLGQIIKEYKVIVDKSTVPVGTAEQVTLAIRNETDVPFAVVSNPEFLREGFAVEDFMHPERVIIGTEDERAKQIMKEVYLPFVNDGNALIFMDEKSAELTKYAANSFLATKITFMNEVANFCEIVGADVDKVRKGMGTDSRIGHRFLYPGIGFGGSCFPKDVHALMRSGHKNNFNFQILDSVLDVNQSQRTILVHKLIEYFGDLKGKRIALWGLSFKPDTDDIREAPALYIIDEIINRGGEVVAFDPEAMENVKKEWGNKITCAENQYNALEGADALVIATEWAVFKNPDFNLIRSKLNQPVIFDGRNLFDLQEIREKGFYYNSIGRETIIPNL